MENKGFWKWYYRNYRTEVEKKREEWEKWKSGARMLSLPPSEKCDEVIQGLQKIATQKRILIVRRLAESSIILRRLSSVDVPMYRAALNSWQEDFLEVCRELDSSGVSAAIANYAMDELQNFSFEKNGKEIAKALGLERLVLEWGVPYEKYGHYWPYVDKSVRKVFTRTGLESQFKIEDIAKNSFRVLDQPGFTMEWAELSPFDWGKFCSIVAISLGAIAGGPIGVAGILVGAAYLASEDDEGDEGEEGEEGGEGGGSGVGNV